jgi:hypothetical protein
VQLVAHMKWCGLVRMLSFEPPLGHSVRMLNSIASCSAGQVGSGPARASAEA